VYWISEAGDLMVSSITATLEVWRSSAAVLNPSARRSLAALLPCVLIVLASASGRAFTSSLLMAAFPCSDGCGSQPMATTAEVSMFLCMAAAT
jgi:hypothetical protein